MSHRISIVVVVVIYNEPPLEKIAPGSAEALSGAIFEY